MRELGVKSKAQVVSAALRTLKERTDQERLRSEIRESVQRCAEADRREDRLLAPGGVTRHDEEDPVEIRRGSLYLVDFNPRIKTKPGKLRPAIVLQSDRVN